MIFFFGDQMAKSSGSMPTLMSISTSGQNVKLEIMSFTILNTKLATVIFVIICYRGCCV